MQFMRVKVMLTTFTLVQLRSQTFCKAAFPSRVAAARAVFMFLAESRRIICEPLAAASVERCLALSQR